MITKTGIVKILDFGMAKLANQNRITKTGATPGTLSYMSPEQIRGEEIDERTDLWSLGVILYEMVTGRLPFHGNCEAATMYAIVNTQPEPIQDIRPVIPESVRAVLKRALQKDPANRYQSAAEFIQDLQACQAADIAAPTIIVPRAKKTFTPATHKIIAAAVAVIFIFILIFQLCYWGAGSNPIPANSEKVVAIFPFTVRGAPDFSYLQDGMMELLYTNLNAPGDFRGVDPRALLNQVKLLRKTDVTIEEAKKIARLFSAGYMILGSLFVAEGKLRFHAALYDLADEENASFALNAESSQDSPFELADKISLQVVSKYSRALTASGNFLENKSTRSLPALKAYLEGLKADRSGLFTEAHELYSQAVKHDSTFALAWFRRSLVNYGFLFNMEQAETDLNTALYHCKALSEHDRLLLLAHQASLRGECEKAMQDFEQIVARYPDDVFGWESVALNWLQWANLLGHTIPEKRYAFQRLLALDPENGTYYQQFLLMALARGRTSEIDSVIARIQQFSPNHSWAWPVIAARAYIDDEAVLQQKIIQEAQVQEDMILQAAIANSAVFAKNVSSVYPLVRTLLHRPRSASAQISYYQDLAVLDLSRGKWHEAMDRLDSLKLSTGDYGTICRGLYNPLYYYHIADAKPARDVQAIETWWLKKTLLAGATDFDFKPLPALFSYLQWYFSGLINHFDDNAGRTIAFSQRLLQAEKPEEAVSVIRIWAATLQALQAMRKQDEIAALQFLEKEPVIIRFPLYFSPLLNLGFQRYLRAELLNRLGRYEEALNWYRSIAGFFDLPYRAPAVYQCAQINEKIGKQDEAIRDYQRFLEWWRDCDPEFRFMTRTAERRLAQLLSEKSK